MYIFFTLIIFIMMKLSHRQRHSQSMIQVPTNDEEIIKLRKRQENSYLHD